MESTPPPAVGASDEESRLREKFKTFSTGGWRTNIYHPRHPFGLLNTYEKRSALSRLFARAGADPVEDPPPSRRPGGWRILDVGCGAGHWLQEFRRWGVPAENLAGVDLVEERIEQAREACPGADLRAGSGAELPFAAGSFDVVCQFVVFSSVLDEGLRRRIAAEMLRVLAPGGFILWDDRVKYALADGLLGKLGAKPLLRFSEREVLDLFPGCRVAARTRSGAVAGYRLWKIPPKPLWAEAAGWLPGFRRHEEWLLLRRGA